MRGPVLPPEPPDELPVNQAEPVTKAPHPDPAHTYPAHPDSAHLDPAHLDSVHSDPAHTLLDGTRLGEQGTWAGRWRTLSRLPMTLMITSVLLGLGIVQLTFHLGNSIYRSVTWQQQIRQTNARVQDLQRDVNILRDAEQAASNPAYLEELARCQGYVRKNENVIVSPKAPTTPGENCQVIRLP